MKVTFYYHSRQPKDVWKTKLQLLGRIEEEKNIVCEIIDTRELSNEEREAVYFDEVTPWSVRKTRGVRAKFIGPRRSGEFFGREVPALLVFEDDTLMEVYPRREGARQVKIEDFLSKLLRSA